MQNLSYSECMANDMLHTYVHVYIQDMYRSTGDITILLLLLLPTPEGAARGRVHIYISQILSKLCYNIYITLCNLTYKKDEGSTGSNGDCSKLLCLPLPNLISINTWYPEHLCGRLHQRLKL